MVNSEQYEQARTAWSSVRALGLPVSGAICGMALLLGWFVWRHAAVPEDLAKAADGILANMGILFVPAGVGIMNYWDLLTGAWLRTIPVGLLGLSSPLIPVVMTLGVYQLASWLFQRTARHPLCNPVFLTVCVLAAMLALTRTPYERYFQGAQFIHFLLGPAVVALAVPLYRHLDIVQRQPIAIVAGIGVGLLVAALSAPGIAWFLGADFLSIVSITPKSVTAPVAMGISQALGGTPPLTAILAILTGMLGASVGPGLLNLLGITDAAARGLAMGTASHGIGTARALQECETAGAFSGLAMGLAALSMAVLMPFGWKIASVAVEHPVDPIVQGVPSVDPTADSATQPGLGAISTNDRRLMDAVKDMTVEVRRVASLLAARETEHLTLTSELSELKKHLRFLEEAHLSQANKVSRSETAAEPPQKMIIPITAPVTPATGDCDNARPRSAFNIELRFQRYQELLDAEHLHDLERVVDLATKCANARITITSYPYNSRSHSANVRLSRRRAELVAKYLIAHQIKPKSISVANGSGEDRAKTRSIGVSLRFER